MHGLALLTVSSRFMAHEAPTHAPYQRVVGVETPAGLIACRYALTEEPQVTRLDEVDEDTAAIVADFFERYIADVDPERTDGTSSKMRYNCHVFALAIQGENVTNPRELDKRLATIEAHAASFGGYLAAGRHGIVRNEAIEDMSHSFVGLGEHTPLTLQVVSHNSNIGLMPYNQVLSEYARYQGGEYTLAA